MRKKLFYALLFLLLSLALALSGMGQEEPPGGDCITPENDGAGCEV